MSKRCAAGESKVRKSRRGREWEGERERASDKEKATWR